MHAVRQSIDPNLVDPSELGPPPDDGRGPNSALADDGTNAGPAIIGVCWMFVALSAMFLTTRMVVKLRARRGFWWDDYILLGSWLMLVGYAVTATLAVRQGGLGTHNGNPSAIQLIISIWTIFSSFGACWSKTSFAVTLLRFTEGRMKIVLWIVIVTLNVVMTFNAILPFIWCNPSSKAWNPFMRGSCWDRIIVIDYTIFGAAYSAGMDFILAIIPWFVLMKLNMKRNEKIGVAFAMSLGIVAGATSIVRSVKVPLLFQNDFTYEAGQLAMWTAAEISVTIIAASIPVLRTMIKSIVSKNKSYGQWGKSGTFRNKTHTTVISSAGVGVDRSTLRAKGSNSGEGESTESLGLPRQDGIIKSESIMVDYDYDTSPPGTKKDAGGYVFGYEMDQVASKNPSSRAMV